MVQKIQSLLSVAGHRHFVAGFFQEAGGDLLVYQVVLHQQYAQRQDFCLRLRRLAEMTQERLSEVTSAGNRNMNGDAEHHPRPQAGVLM